MNKRWHVIETKAKAERLARDEIAKLGLDAYLPEYQIERFNRRKRVTIINTLCHFPRYLFVEMDVARDTGRVLACRGVADILPGIPLSPQPVPAKDVLELRAAQAALVLRDDWPAQARGECGPGGAHTTPLRIAQPRPMRDVDDHGATSARSASCRARQSGQENFISSSFAFVVKRRKHRLHHVCGAFTLPHGSGAKRP